MAQGRHESAGADRSAPAPIQSIPLGSSDLRVSPLGVGTWAWGDRLYWGYGRGYGAAELESTFQACLAAGLNFFDTAEVYGTGKSERLLGRFCQDSGRPVVIATKFMPLPWRLWRGSLRRALRGSLRRLRVEQADLYQIHWPAPPVPIETWMAALADAVAAGLTRAVGVSNFNVPQLRRAHAALARRGVPLASNQVEFSLLQRQPEWSGLLEACRELDVSLIAYSPLALGALTGKYTPEHPLTGVRGRLINRARLASLQPLIDTLRELGAAHGGKTPAQVALNWVICKGAIPIPGAKSARQARENAGALGWRLAPGEVDALDAASARLR